MFQPDFCGVMWMIVQESQNIDFKYQKSIEWLVILAVNWFKWNAQIPNGNDPEQPTSSSSLRWAFALNHCQLRDLSWWSSFKFPVFVFRNIDFQLNRRSLVLWFYQLPIRLPGTLLGRIFQYSEWNLTKNLRRQIFNLQFWQSIMYLKC